MTWLINALIGLSTKVINRRPKQEFDSTLFKKLLWVVSNRNKVNKTIDFKYEDIDEKLLDSALKPVLNYILNRHDCADFRCLQLLKFKLVANDLLEKYPNANNKIKDTLLSFKFWITSFGKDSMCYYSENHQIVFIACEYLIGILYPNEIFAIDNKTGIEHIKIAKDRFDYWMELRNKYSYSEFYSTNYMPVNLSALAMLLEYSKDDSINIKVKEQIDTILSFYATNTYSGCATSASGRDYSRNMMNCSFKEPNSKEIIETIWGDKEYANNNYLVTCWLFADMYLNSSSYQIPNDIYNKYFEKETISTRKFGLDLAKYKDEGLYSNDTKAMMMRLGSGALTNPEIINLTYDMMYKYKLWSNDFLYWLRYIEIPLVRWLGLLPTYSKVAKIYQSRMALGEANVYTYRNEYFKLSTAIKYQVGFGGSQKNTVSLVLPKGITIYTTHPLVDSNLKNHNYNSTPSYFGGYCFAPHGVQDKNVAMLIYDLPKHKNAFQFYKILKFTHSYFPTELFDEYEINNNYAFAKVNNTYVALIGKNSLTLKENSNEVFKTTNGLLKNIKKSFDLVQEGSNTYWIYEVSSSNIETYKDFKTRIKNNKISFANNKLDYISNRSYSLEYNKDFIINNKKINQEYEYDFSYIKSK